MQVVALLDRRDDGNCFAFGLGQFGQRDYVARQRAAGERSSRSEISFRPDARLALETHGNFLGVGTGMFAKAGDLVDESDRQRKK